MAHSPTSRSHKQSAPFRCRSRSRPSSTDPALPDSRAHARKGYPGSLSNRLLISHSYVALARAIGEFLRSLDGASEVLLIAPSKGAADDLARRCSPSGVLGLHRMTLNQLAAAAA